jgi:hypothetical protein
MTKKQDQLTSEQAAFRESAVDETIRAGAVWIEPGGWALVAEPEIGIRDVLSGRGSQSWWSEVTFAVLGSEGKPVALNHSQSVAVERRLDERRDLYPRGWTIRDDPNGVRVESPTGLASLSQYPDRFGLGDRHSRWSKAEISLTGTHVSSETALAYAGELIVIANLADKLNCRAVQPEQD